MIDPMLVPKSTEYGLGHHTILQENGIYDHVKRLKHTPVQNLHAFINIQAM